MTEHYFYILDKKMWLIFFTVFFFLFIISFILYKLNNKILLYKNEKNYDLSNNIYEYGSSTIGNLSSLSNTNFYILGIIFILFDTELIFFYPWIISSETLIYNNIGYFSMIIFIELLFLSIVFEIKNTILNFYKSK